MNIRFTPIAMAVALALHSPLLFSLDRQSAVEKLKDLAENSPIEVNWQDTDRTATSDFVKLARAIHVDTGVDLRSFNEGEKRTKIIRLWIARILWKKTALNQ
ncbi:hypothetical protein ACLS0F_01350 [Avibacterium endocarditidis]|nr:hypothetical protein [Avibacterium endocarditidis]